MRKNGRIDARVSGRISIGLVPCLENNNCLLNYSVNVDMSEIDCRKEKFSVADTDFWVHPDAGRQRYCLASSDENVSMPVRFGCLGDNPGVPMPGFLDPELATCPRTWLSSENSTSRRLSSTSAESTDWKTRR